MTDSKETKEEYSNAHNELQLEYIDVARDVLTTVYEDYKDKGILSIYLWGSVTRDDWDPTVSDIDAMAIVDHTVDLDERKKINEHIKEVFPYDMKLGLQFYGIEELNGGEPYTLLSRYQPAGYLLLRFNDWLPIVGKQYQRSDFAVENFTPAEARTHQLNQAVRALKIISGEMPIDDGRHGLQSMVEDVVKGAIGALYWEAVEAGYTGVLDYDDLPNIVGGERKNLTEKLIAIRRENAYTPENVLPLRDEIESI